MFLGSEQVFVIWSEQQCGYLTEAGEITFKLKEAQSFLNEADAQNAITRRKLPKRYTVRGKRKPKE